MPDTLTLHQRYDASNVIQRALAQDPIPEAGKQYWLGMDRGEAISMIGTLRGQDTLDLGDKVRAALEKTGGELSLVVTDVFRRMDSDEFEEFVSHLTSSINNEPPTDLDEELSRGELSMGGIEQLIDEAIRNVSVGAEEAHSEPGAVHLSAEGIPEFGIGEFDHYPTRAEIEERLERLFPGFTEAFNASSADLHVRNVSEGREVPAGFQPWGNDPGDEDPQRVQVRRTLLRMTPHGVVEVTGAERDEIFRALGVG